MATVFNRQIETARRLITKNGQFVTLRQIVDGVPADPDKPHEPGVSTFVDTQVKMVFFLESRVDQYSQNRVPEELTHKGVEYGLMANVNLNPDLKWVILREGLESRIIYINNLAPDGTPILWKIGMNTVQVPIEEELLIDNALLVDDEFALLVDDETVLLEI